jgi:hypothetical protein
MNRSRKSNKQVFQAKRKGGKGRKRLPNVPFPLLATPSLGHVFQFTSSGAASALSITRNDVLNLLVTAATAITSYPMIAAIKIKKIRAWAPIISSYVPQAMEIEWNGGLYAPSAIHSAVSDGTFPAKLETRPPPGSSPDLWSLTGASNIAEDLFSITCPANTVIQLSVALRLMDDEAPGASYTVAGATVGKVYYGYLDGPVATGILPPSGGVAIAP